MKRKLPFVFVGLAWTLLLPLIARAQGSAPAPASDWSFNVSPYIWIAGVEIDTTLDRSPPSTPPETSKFETKITGGFLLAAQARYKDVGLWVDFVWLRTNTESTNPGPAFSGMDLESNIYHTTLAMSFQLPAMGDFHADLIAGARLWSVNEDLTVKSGRLPGFTASSDNTWTDPIVGLDLRYDLGPKWTLLTKGTVSVAADDSEGWEVMGGVAYRFGKGWSGALGYRFLHEEFSKGRFKFSTDISGCILGASYRF